MVIWSAAGSGRRAKGMGISISLLAGRQNSPGRRAMTNDDY